MSEETTRITDKQGEMQEAREASEEEEESCGRDPMIYGMKKDRA